MIIRLNREYGRPWKVIVGQRYVGTFALLSQAKEAEHEATELYRETGKSLKRSSKERIPKKYAKYIEAGKLEPEQCLAIRGIRVQPPR